MSQFQENLQTDRKMDDGRTDGQTLSYRALPVDAEDPIMQMIT